MITTIHHRKLWMGELVGGLNNRCLSSWDCFRSGNLISSWDRYISWRWSRLGKVAWLCLLFCHLIISWIKVLLLQKEDTIINVYKIMVVLHYNYASSCYSTTYPFQQSLLKERWMSWSIGSHGKLGFKLCFFLLLNVFWSDLNKIRKTYK